MGLLAHRRVDTMVTSAQATREMKIASRWLSNDLGVALDSEGTVVCFQSALY
jgi:hypothetical protein